MKIKAKQVFCVGAFIVLTLIGYIFMPKDEIIRDLKADDIYDATFNQGLGKSGDFIKKDTIFVHIEGAVNSPGLKEVFKGTRVFEVIALASGECIDADLSKINLASIVKDEQKIYVPYKMSQLPESVQGTDVSVSGYSEFININTATSEELQQLDGIGPSMAKKILDYREDVGYFSAIEDIKNVSGIGESKYNKIKDNITI